MIPMMELNDHDPLPVFVSGDVSRESRMWITGAEQSGTADLFPATVNRAEWRGYGTGGIRFDNTIFSSARSVKPAKQRPPGCALACGPTRSSSGCGRGGRGGPTTLRSDAPSRRPPSARPGAAVPPILPTTPPRCLPTPPWCRTASRARRPAGTGGGRIRRAALRRSVALAKVRQGHKFLRLGQRYTAKLWQFHPWKGSSCAVVKAFPDGPRSSDVLFVVATIPLAPGSFAAPPGHT